MRIRPPLLYSLLLNGVLGGILGYREYSTTHLQEVCVAPVVQVPLPQPSEPPALPAPTPFQWSSLESADYPTYIANLRKIGCPESTIRDIILADVQALYARKREALTGVSLEPSKLPGTLSALQEEERLLLNRLLGIARPSPQASSLVAQQEIKQSPPVPATPSITAQTASLPLVFVPLKAETLKLNERQQALLDRLRQTFVQQIGGLNQNPNDSLYLDRWQQAQATADEQLKSALGNELYARYQMESRRQSKR